MLWESYFVFFIKTGHRSVAISKDLRDSRWFDTKRKTLKLWQTIPALVFYGLMLILYQSMFVCEKKERSSSTKVGGASLYFGRLNDLECPNVCCSEPLLVLLALGTREFCVQDKFQFQGSTVCRWSVGNGDGPVLVLWNELSIFSKSNAQVSSC